MKIRTNSDVIRQFIMSALNILQNKIRNVFKKYNVVYNEYIARFALNSSLYQRYAKESEVYNLLLTRCPNAEVVKTNKGLIALEKAVFLSDYYIVTTYKLKTQNEDSKSSKTYNTLKTIREKSFDYITESLDLVTMMELIKEIKNASFYKRIVIFKSLNESDVEFLKSINPFFEEEYKLYGIDITPEFIVEEINKQHETNLPNEAIYQEISRLLADLYRVDDDLINDVICDIIETLNINGEDISTMIDLLDSDCANDIDEVLASLIEQYYKIKKDEKKYEK